MGCRTAIPLVVIESDDWGSIRMPDKKTYNILKSKNIDVFSNPFNKYDTLEQSEDMDILHDRLNQILNDTGKKAVITANTVMANPDFHKIEKHDFEEYHYEIFTDTYLNYGYNHAWESFESMVTAGFFKPQFHAREHLNACRWLGLIKTDNKNLKIAFDHHVFSIDFTNELGHQENLMAAYWYRNEKEEEFIHKAIMDGQKIFTKLFGFNSVSTIAPVGIWDEKQEATFASIGIRSMQSFLLQKMPKGDKLVKAYRYCGLKRGDLYFFPRNVYFEPSTDFRIDWVNKAFSQIERALLFKKPAIISTHRLNFVGGLDPQLRDNNIKKLDVLLRRIIKKWPDVRFISSDLITKYI